MLDSEPIASLIRLWVDGFREFSKHKPMALQLCLQVVWQFIQQEICGHWVDREPKERGYDPTVLQIDQDVRVNDARA